MSDFSYYRNALKDPSAALIFVRENFRMIILHSWIALSLTAGLSYVAGFMRDRLVAQYFGATTELDIFYAAFSVPDLIFAIIVTSTIGAAFVPIFTKSWSSHQEGKVQLSDRPITLHRDAGAYAYSLLIALLAIVFFLCALAIAFSPLLAELLTPSQYSQEQKDLYAHLMQIMLLSPIIFTISTIFGGVLLSTRDFFFYGAAPVFYNLGIIAGLYWLVPLFGVYGLAVGTVFGAVLHMLSRLVIGVGRMGYRQCLEYIRLWKNPLLSETFFLTLPKILHVAAWQVLLLWFVRLAGEIQEGGPTMYNYARNFQSMPASLIGISIALSAFSLFCSQSARGDRAGFFQTIRRKIPLVFILTTCAAVALYFVAPFLVSLLLGGGNFSEAATQQTAFLLQVYVLSIPFESLTHMLARGCYALKKTFVPSLVNVGMVVFTIALSWTFHTKYAMGLESIPYAFLCGLILQNILLFVLLRYYAHRHFI